MTADIAAGDITVAQATGRVIDRFGGIRPMATKLAVPVTTVQGWKKRGLIPQVRHADIRAAALREGITLDLAELAATDSAGVARPIDMASEPDLDITAPPSASVQSPVAARGNGVAYTALAVSILVAAGVAGGGYAVWQVYLAPLRAKVASLEAGTGAQANDDLVRRVAKLEADIARPASAPSPASGTVVAGDGDRLAALERQVADLKAGSAQTEQLTKNLSDLQVAAGGRELLAQSIRDNQSSTAAMQGEVERLSGQVTALGGRLDKVDAVLADRRQQALRAEAIVLAVGQLRAALATPKPFLKEIAALRAMVGNDAEMVAALDRIQPFADTGVPTADELTRDFGRMAPVLVRSAVVGDGQSWWRQALYHVETVISIRRVGENTPGDTTDAIVARAEGKVDDGDFSGAINILQSLTGLPAEMASSWVHDAGHRVTVDSAEADLSQIAIDRIASGHVAAGTGMALPASPPPGDGK